GVAPASHEIAVDSACVLDTFCEGEYGEERLQVRDAVARWRPAGDLPLRQLTLTSAGAAHPVQLVRQVVLCCFPPERDTWLAVLACEGLSLHRVSSGDVLGVPMVGPLRGVWPLPSGGLLLEFEPAAERSLYSLSHPLQVPRPVRLA